MSTGECADDDVETPAVNAAHPASINARVRSASTAAGSARAEPGMDTCLANSVKSSTFVVVVVALPLGEGWLNAVISRNANSDHTPSAVRVSGIALPERRLLADDGLATVKPPELPPPTPPRVLPETCGELGSRNRAPPTLTLILRCC